MSKEIQYWFKHIIQSYKNMFSATVKMGDQNSGVRISSATITDVYWNPLISNRYTRIVMELLIKR